MKSENVVRGIVERVGSVGYPGDVHYMTMLLRDGNEIFTLLFQGNTPASNTASLTQAGDQVEFTASESGRVQAKTFTNKTVAERLQE
jgi:hypothetical protein